MFGTVGTPKISQIDVLASGLDSPRKLSFGLDGALYVAEAGRGGTGASIPSPSRPGVSLSYGATGAITRIQNGVAQRVVTGLPSLAAPDGTEAAGVNDIQFDRDGNAYAIVGLGSNPANREKLNVPDFAQLIGIDRFDGGASWTKLSDFGAYVLAEMKLEDANATSPIYQIIDTSKLFLRANLLDDSFATRVREGAFNYVYNTGGDRDPDASVISQTL